MKIKCIAIGKTKNQELISLIKSYISKIKHYINFEFVIINDIKSTKNKNMLSIKESPRTTIVDPRNSSHVGQDTLFISN